MTAPSRAGRSGDSQPLPIPNEHLDVQTAVIADIEHRRDVGIGRVPLRSREGEVIAEALVESRDYPRVMDQGPWYRGGNGYAQRTWGKGPTRRHAYLHRFVMELGPDDEVQVDHLNRNRLDCRRANLRLVSNAENAQNRDSLPGSVSGYRGVTWDKERGKWLASVMREGRRVHLGRFDDEEAAAAAASSWRAENMPLSLDAVAADVATRREVGVSRYGTALQPHDGRNALLDAYEQALDLAMYLKQRLIEDGVA